jgi:Bacterial RNA polymerase, alpha chain C terminal domain.
MRNDDTFKLLHQPISTLGLSLELTSVTEMQGYYTLADLIKRTTDELMTLPGFTQHLLYEYVNFMETNGYGELIDPM